MQKTIGKRLARKKKAGNEPMMPHKVPMIISATIILAFLFSPLVHADLADIVIDHSPGHVDNPQVTSDGNGNVYTVWEDTRNGSSDIYFNYSTDYGFTWQDPDIRIDTDVLGASHSRRPQIACDNTGHVYAVWEDQRNGGTDIYFNYSSNYGVTWQSSDKKLNSVLYALIPQYPKITCDNSGHVYVVWDDNYFNTSADYGVSWLSAATRISTTGGVETKITCDQNAHVYVAWRSSDILFNYSSDFGNSWQSDITISDIYPVHAIPYGLSLNSNESGNVYFAWDDGRNRTDFPDVYFNSCSNYGSICRASSDIKLNTGTPGTIYSIWPKVISDETGHVYVAWYDRRNGLGDIYMNSSSDHGITWQNPDMRLDTDSAGSADSGFPEIATDDSGHIYAIWTDDQSGIGAGLYINYSLDYGVTWLPENRKISSEGFNLQMVADVNRFYIVRNANNNVVFNEVAPLEVPPFAPADPYPASGATQIGLTPILSWQTGDANLDDTLTYDVYFGTTSPPPLVSANQTEMAYLPGTLAYFTNYYWQVIGRDNLGSETAGPIWSFQTISGPPQFTGFSPSDGATDIPLAPILGWTAVDNDLGDTLTYDVYFGKTYPPAKQVSDWTSNTYNPGLLTRYTVYYWKVVARDNHGTETVGPVLIFTTINHKPQFQGPFSPADGAQDVTFTPTLKWNASDADGDVVTYDIYFGASPDPPLILSNKTIKSYQPVLPPNKLPHVTTYYWKIVARDNHGAETESPIMSFTTADNPPAILNFSPQSAAVKNVTPTLSWSAADPDPDDTLVYDIYFGTSPNPPLVLSNQADTSYQPGQLAFETKYYWTVVAKDPHWDPVTKRGEKSMMVIYFTTVSANAPPVFGSSFLPLDGATGRALRPQLSWSASDPDGDTIAYDVYFGTSTSPPLVVSDQTVRLYNPGMLLALTTYYWKVVARDNHGNETVSSIFSFTTGNPPSIQYAYPNPCNTNQVVSIVGKAFGAEQGTSVLHLGGTKFGLGYRKVLFWSDTRIDFRIPAFLTWLHGTRHTRDLWVTVGVFSSNKIKLTMIRK